MQNYVTLCKTKETKKPLPFMGEEAKQESKLRICYITDTKNLLLLNQGLFAILDVDALLSLTYTLTSQVVDSTIVNVIVSVNVI